MQLLTVHQQGIPRITNCFCVVLCCFLFSYCHCKSGLVALCSDYHKHQLRQKQKNWHFDTLQKKKNKGNWDILKPNRQSVKRNNICRLFNLTYSPNSTLNKKANVNVSVTRCTDCKAPWGKLWLKINLILNYLSPWIEVIILKKFMKLEPIFESDYGRHFNIFTFSSFYSRWQSLPFLRTRDSQETIQHVDFFTH